MLKYQESVPSGKAGAQTYTEDPSEYESTTLPLSYVALSHTTIGVWQFCLLHLVD